MNQNPYAAPALPYAPPPPPPGSGEPGPLRASDMFSLAWERFKQCWGPPTGAYFIIWIASAATGQAPTVLRMLKLVPQSTLALWQLGTLLVSLVVTSFLHIGFIRMSLQAARGQDPEFGVLFSGADRFLPMLGLTVLTWLLFIVGCAALIVPGVLLMLIFSFAGYYVVDADMGPVQALDASAKATRNQWGEVLVLWVLFTLVAIAGMMLCCVGMIASLPLAQLAVTYAFIRLSGRGSLPPSGLPNEWSQARAG
jgi:uncharacterized membrane protein